MFKKVNRTHFTLLMIVALQLVVAWGINLGNMKMSISMALCISQFTILLPFLIYCFIEKQNPLKVIRFRKVKPISVFFAFMIALFSYPIVIFLNMVSMLFVENAMTDVMPAVLDMGLIPGLFFMAVLPAVVEETIFRGMLYNTYSKYRPVAGIILSAVLFGLMHMNFNQMLYAIYLGIIMAIVMEVSDSIIPSMVIHFTMNASSTIMVFLSESLPGVTEKAASMDLIDSLKESFAMTAEEIGMELAPGQLEGLFPVFLAAVIIGFAFIALVALVLVFIMIYAVANINGRPLKQVMKKKDEEDEKKRFIDIWLVIFVLYTLFECIKSALL